MPVLSTKGKRPNAPTASGVSDRTKSARFGSTPRILPPAATISDSIERYGRRSSAARSIWRILTPDQSRPFPGTALIERPEALRSGGSCARRPSGCPTWIHPSAVGTRSSRPAGARGEGLKSPSGESPAGRSTAVNRWKRRPRLLES